MKIYVGNLSWNIDDAKLNELFSKHGKVTSASVITDRYSGRSKGFGFVEVEDADAEKAISSMNGQKFGDREIVVNEARPKTERSDRPRGDFGSRM